MSPVKSNKALKFKKPVLEHVCLGFGPKHMLEHTLWRVPKHMSDRHVLARNMLGL